MKKYNIKRMVIIGLLIAMQIILSRFLSISTPIVRIGFSFLPIAILGILYGPLYAGLGSAIGDVIGTVLFGPASIFPGFTLSAFLTGVVYGVLLHNKQKKLWRVCLAVAIINIFISLLLGTFWLSILTGKGYLALVPTKIIQNVAMFPVKVVTIWVVAYRVLNIESQNKVALQ
nr:folate family ECF transporter S component [Clostridioides sp.]